MLKFTAQANESIKAQLFPLTSALGSLNWGDDIQNTWNRCKPLYCMFQGRCTSQYSVRQFKDGDKWKTVGGNVYMPLYAGMSDDGDKDSGYDVMDTEIQLDMMQFTEL